MHCPVQATTMAGNEVLGPVSPSSLYRVVDRASLLEEDLEPTRVPPAGPGPLRPGTQPLRCLAGWSNRISSEEAALED